jgi:hypothetical protein
VVQQEAFLASPNAQNRILSDLNLAMRMVERQAFL